MINGSFDAEQVRAEDTIHRSPTGSGDQIWGRVSIRDAPRRSHCVICPYCNEDNDKVIDSRSAEAGSVVRRRRQCLMCGKRFTTYERVEKTARLMVIKKDGSRVQFDSQSILRGVQSACGKRPIPEEAKLRLVREVEDELHREYEREVPSHEVGELVAAKLRAIDEIAYIRYASEYYEFKTLGDLADELNHLRDRTKDLPNQQPLFQDRSSEGQEEVPAAEEAN